MTLNLVLIIIELLLYYIYVQLILIECHKDRDTIVQNRQKAKGDCVTTVKYLSRDSLNRIH